VLVYVYYFSHNYL